MATETTLEKAGLSEELEQVQRILAERGLLKLECKRDSEVKQEIWKPIAVEGNAVSETIIAERR